MLAWNQLYSFARATRDIKYRQGNLETRESAMPDGVPLAMPDPHAWRIGHTHSRARSFQRSWFKHKLEARRLMRWMGPVEKYCIYCSNAYRCGQSLKSKGGGLDISLLRVEVESCERVREGLPRSQGGRESPSGLRHSYLFARSPNLLGGCKEIYSKMRTHVRETGSAARQGRAPDRPTHDDRGGRDGGEGATASNTSPGREGGRSGGRQREHCEHYWTGTG